MAALDFDPYVFETLMPDLVGHDRRPSAFLVYLAIANASRGKRVALSYADLAERTGLSKRAAQDAVVHLLRRELVECQKRGPTETPHYRALTPWQRWRRKS